MQFIDLHRQYDHIETSIKTRIEKVLSHKGFIMGPEVAQLEEELAKFVGRKYALTCSNGTDALVLPLMAYQLKETDAVFVPSFTFFASAESVSLAGGTPVFVDSDCTYNLDPVKLKLTIQKTIAEGKLTPRGIMTVDIFGLPVDYDRVYEIAKEYDLFIIEDTAQGFGGSYHGKKNGSFGDVSATSFFPAKPLGCYGDGGAIFTDNDELAQRLKSLRVHGQGSSRYDNVQIGLNARLDTLQAAILLSKLEIFDDEIEQRQLVAQQYMEQLQNVVSLPVVPNDCISAWAQFTVMVDTTQQRELIIDKMRQNNIPIMVYYAVPMHLQTAYQNLKYKKGDLPVCEKMSDCVLSLPMHPYLTTEEILLICDILKDSLK